MKKKKYERLYDEPGKQVQKRSTEMTVEEKTAYLEYLDSLQTEFNCAQNRRRIAKQDAWVAIQAKVGSYRAQNPGKYDNLYASVHMNARIDMPWVEAMFGEKGLNRYITTEIYTLLEQGLEILPPKLTYWSERKKQLETQNGRTEKQKTMGDDSGSGANRPLQLSGIGYSGDDRPGDDFGELFDWPGNR